MVTTPSAKMRTCKIFQKMLTSQVKLPSAGTWAEKWGRAYFQRGCISGTLRYHIFRLEFKVGSEKSHCPTGKDAWLKARGESVAMLSPRSVCNMVNMVNIAVVNVMVCFFTIRGLPCMWQLGVAMWTL